MSVGSGNLYFRRKMMKKTKKSIFDSPVFKSRIKSANTTLFPEGVLGYLVGPTLALLANSILSNYFNQYMTDVLKINDWLGEFGKLFFTWLPVISVIFVVAGNIIVGRLLDRAPSKAGKARPLLLLSVPVSLIALIVLFVLLPNPDGITEGQQIFGMVTIAIGYILWFGFAYPLYYTPHAALVNLSTRSSKDRSLLATLSNATALAAMGVTSMILPFFLGLLFKRVTDPALVPEGAKPLPDGGFELNGSIIYDQSASFNAWKVFVIALIIITFIGAVIEFMFTRERVTEETLTASHNEEKKALPFGEQAAICFKDKFWWIMMVFFFLYQLGGMLKNVSQLYYCAANFGTVNPETGNMAYGLDIGGTFSGTIGIVGAIPTAIGMVIAVPLSNKIGKGKSILFGSIIAAAGGVLGLFANGNFIVAVVAFVIKALGSTPAMYLSLALLGDVFDHQEAMTGKKTDGFTMMIYGAIMAGMTGIATGIMNGVIAAYGAGTTGFDYQTIAMPMSFIFFGGEALCYVVIFIIFLFMGVEKFSAFDHKAIVMDQKAAAAAAGVEYVDPAVKLALEEEEANKAADAARMEELKVACEKKGLNFEAEKAKYQENLAKKQAEAAAKKEAAEKAKAEKQAAKIAAMTEEEKAAIKAKEEEKAKKQAEIDAKVLVEFNKLRKLHGQPILE